MHSYDEEGFNCHYLVLSRCISRYSALLATSVLSFSLHRFWCSRALARCSSEVVLFGHRRRLLATEEDRCISEEILSVWDLWEPINGCNRDNKLFSIEYFFYYSKQSHTKAARTVSNYKQSRKSVSRVRFVKVNNWHNCLPFQLFSKQKERSHYCNTNVASLHIPNFFVSIALLTFP